MSTGKQEPLTAVTMSGQPKLIRVVAPTNLPGGYQIEVTTDSHNPITFTASVPPKGVKAGDVFLTPPPPGYVPPYPTTEAPVGRWKDGLCDLFNNGCCSAQAWMAICFPELAMGQVMHRFRLTWLGALVAPNERMNTFKTVLAIVVAYYVFDFAISLYLDSNLAEGEVPDTPLLMTVAFVKDFVVMAFGIWRIYALCQTRKHVRTTYSIPENSCGGCEDCLCSTFCSCCTVAQIGRHTGEYEKYPSLCCNDTGLPNHAPNVV